MGTCRAALNLAVICWLPVLWMPGEVQAQERWLLIPREQRRMEIRDPASMPTARLPNLPPPLVVSDSEEEEPVPGQKLSLDEAIRTALANSEVLRVLSGFSAASTGRTIYDPAISNTQIDQQRGRFDPALEIGNNFRRQEPPAAAFVPGDPSRARIGSVPVHDYDMAMGLSKTTRWGGIAGLKVDVNPSRRTADGLPLNPQTRSSVELSFTQPLLQGGGPRANLAPLLIARIDTERSFYQIKGSAEQLVRSVIEGYWALVFARTDVWARRQQVEQGQHAFDLAEATLRRGLGSAADVAQARSALADFRAALITAEANVLQREAALQNVMGIPPSPFVRIVPTTPPPAERLEIDWDSVLRVAEERRPDLIELKLVVEADEQRLAQARNQALPRVDATALHRWDGLGGRMPDGSLIASHPGQFTGWQLGVNVSMPLGLRQSRAALRQQELVLMRDRANLQQGLHNAIHELATTYRDLARFYEQYQAFQEARTAAHNNLDVQFQRYQSGLPTLYLNVLQAIASWGNAVSAESQALVSYNAELANLEARMGTILETHGVWFVEERYGSIGPPGRLFHPRCYPRDRRPGRNEDRYEQTSEPAENAFNLKAPIPKRRKPARPGASSPPPEAGRLRLLIPERIPPPAPQR